MMIIKPEVIRSLEREKEICSLAIHHLEAMCKNFEERYHWTTEVFLQRFEDGSAGDDEDFFRWHAIAQGLADWKATRNALGEFLVD